MKLSKRVMVAFAAMALTGCNVFEWKPFSRFEDKYSQMKPFNLKVDVPGVKDLYEPKIKLDKKDSFKLGLGSPYEFEPFNLGAYEIADKID